MGDFGAEDKHKKVGIKLSFLLSNSDNIANQRYWLEARKLINDSEKADRKTNKKT